MSEGSCLRLSADCHTASGRSPLQNIPSCNRRRWSRSDTPTRLEKSPSIGVWRRALFAMPMNEGPENQSPSLRTPWHQGNGLEGLG